MGRHEAVWFNLNVRIDAEPPVVLRVHRPWVRRGRVAGLRRLRERLGRTQVRVARPIPVSAATFLGSLIVGLSLRSSSITCSHGRARTPASACSRLGRVHTALKAVWEPSPPEPLDDHRTFGQLRYSAGFTRRRLGPRSEPVVRRMAPTDSPALSSRRSRTPITPIHRATNWATRWNCQTVHGPPWTWDFARVRERPCCPARRGRPSRRARTCTRWTAAGRGRLGTGARLSAQEIDSTLTGRRSADVLAPQRTAQPPVSVSVSFTPVRHRSPATAPVMFGQVADGGGHR